jgi:two-component system OmpR family response regulator
MNAMSSVLLITPDASTEALAERALVTGGHDVVTAASCDAAMRSLFNVRIDAIVVDGAVGESEVKEFCVRLETGDGKYPLVFLTSASARWLADSLPDSAARCEIVIKPCEGKEIRAAVERTLDTAEHTGPDVLTIGDVTLDRKSHELHGDSASVQLTPTEFRLMHYLVRRRGNIVSADELLEKVWEFFPGTGSSELVRSHVRNLRGKLRGATGGKDLVQTVPRRGYRLT